MKRILVDLFGQFYIDTSFPNGTRVALTTYSSSAETTYSFDAYSNTSEVQSAIQNTFLFEATFNNSELGKYVLASILLYIFLNAYYFVTTFSAISSSVSNTNDGRKYVNDVALIVMATK